MRYQLLRVLNCSRQNAVQKVHQPLRMRCIFVVKVNTIVLCTNLQNFVVCTVLEYKLFDEVKGFFVLCVLSDLNNSAPGVRGELLFTIVTLHVKLCEFSDECLLHFGLVVELLLNGDFDFNSFGMALSPNESCVDDFGFVKALNFL